MIKELLKRPIGVTMSVVAIVVLSIVAMGYLPVVSVPSSQPGGGFSEIHDLREYRPGDSLHEIHWKLSAKTDKLIVREAEEPDLGLVVLSFDFSGTRTQLDSTLRQLLWLQRCCV